VAIRNTIEMKWHGTSYDVLVTMDVIDKLEDRLNLMLMMQQVQEGDIRFSKAAMLLSLLLQSAGCKVSQDEMYDALFGNSEDITPDGLIEILYTVFASVFPEPPKKFKPRQAAVIRKH